MRATDQEIVLLQKLQEVDRDVLSARKEFEELPHRQAILDSRQKMSGVLKKKTQVQDMLDAAEEELDTLSAEDGQLAIKQKDAEDTLSQVQGDFRSVEAHSKELNGIVKRRAKITADLQAVEDQVARISPVMKQIMQACEELDKQEQRLVASFQQQGCTLKARITEGEQAHSAIADHLSKDLLAAYDTASKRCGGIALARLEKDRCGACRATFDQGRLSQARAQAPVSQCPFCQRLLIVDEEMGS